MDKPICVGCGKKPSELREYIDSAKEERCTPDEYVKSDEGTYNVINGHFLCTKCCIEAGMPSSRRGWKCP